MSSFTRKKRKNANPLTKSEKVYIRLHHKTKSVLQMGQALKRATVSIYKFMDSESLEVYVKDLAKKMHNTPPPKNPKLFYSEDYARGLF